MAATSKLSYVVLISNTFLEYSYFFSNKNVFSSCNLLFRKFPVELFIIPMKV